MPRNSEIKSVHMIETRRRNSIGGAWGPWIGSPTMVFTIRKEAIAARDIMIAQQTHSADRARGMADMDARVVSFKRDRIYMQGEKLREGL